MTAALRLATATLLALSLAPAWGQKVALTGVMGQRALLIIDDAAPAVIGPGEARGGVTLVSAQGEQAVIEINGQRQTLRVGEMPVSVTGKAAASGAGRIVLNAGPGGHFVASGQINGASVRFLVDTGASVVSMSAQEADRIGLAYGNGERLLMSTANGNVVGYGIHLTTVRLGEVEVHNVQAIVTQAPMPFVLLGNSFLTHFQLKQENERLTLDRRF